MKNNSRNGHLCQPIDVSKQAGFGGALATSKPDDQKLGSYQKLGRRSISYKCREFTIVIDSIKQVYTNGEEIVER